MLSRAHRKLVAPADTVNEKGAPAHRSTDRCVVDLFFQLVRQSDPSVDGLPASLQTLLTRAWACEPLLVLKMAFHTRCIVRGKAQGSGKGEKSLFFNLATSLHALDPEVLPHNLAHVPFYGCWKDLLELALRLPALQPQIVQVYAAQLRADATAGRVGSLAAKWAPSERKRFDKSPQRLAHALRHALGLDARGYRRLLSTLRGPQLLETKLCSRVELAAEAYSEFPSQALKYYQKSLKRAERHPHFPEYLARLKRQRLAADAGEDEDVSMAGAEQQAQAEPETKVTISVATLLPHQILQGVAQSPELSEEQWRAYVEQCRLAGHFKNMLPVVDVSGSMAGLPMDVAVALGLLCATLCEGPYANHMVTFSSRPEYHVVDRSLSLAQQLERIRGMEWGTSTDVHAVFAMLLRTAVAHQLRELPTLIVFSDMQFDEANERGAQTNDQAMRELFAEHNFPVPRVVYWNLRGAQQTNFPVQAGCENVQMLSGFSPSLLKLVMRDQLARPEDAVLETLNDPHFARLSLRPRPQRRPQRRPQPEPGCPADAAAAAAAAGPATDEARADPAGKTDAA